ncbi:MAG: hypothetical protein ACPLQO_06260, partial [Desulfotomaculales bacterium]
KNSKAILNFLPQQPFKTGRHPLTKIEFRIFPGFYIFSVSGFFIRCGKAFPGTHKKYASYHVATKLLPDSSRR